MRDYTSPPRARPRVVNIKNARELPGTVLNDSRSSIGMPLSANAASTIVARPELNGQVDPAD